MTKNPNPDAEVGTPEYVAFKMAEYLVSSQREEAETGDEFLAIYAKCLRATKQQRI